jgi:uncharacterized membrane protein YraQ (UPF0718 family)
MLYDAILNGLLSVYDYLSLHVLACLVPAFFIAGAVAVFVSRQSVIIYFSSKTKNFAGNSLISCFTASVIGVLLYMPTLLEVPIIGTTFGYSTGIMGTKKTMHLSSWLYQSRHLPFAYGKVVG